jgi:hypothetical protein
MDLSFFQKIEQGLSNERLRAYAVSQSGNAPDSCATLARYLLNMALCESLYSPLQICEISLRNSVHRYCTSLMGREDWYDDPRFLLTPWATDEILKAKTKIRKSKKTVTASRVVAHYEQNTSFLPGAFKEVFPNLPKSLHRRKERKADLEKIRQLRNRVFHHERIVHWQDLDTQHQLILDVIDWVYPELRQLAGTLDRFTLIRKDGLTPWIEKLQNHWPK